jgi:hypothetical protein
MKVVELVATIAIALIGLYAAHSFRRQQRLKVADKRVDAYRKLWGLMLVARPLRMHPPENMQPLTRGEARTLFDKMTTWYFDDGNGMMFPDDTKRVYLGAKERLGLYADGTGDAPEEGRRRMDELGLLRQQMRSDLAIYGHSYMSETLDDDDRAFLVACDVRPWRFSRPWYSAIARLVWPEQREGGRRRAGAPQERAQLHE